MPAIYISYRKEDTPGAAAHLYKNLSEAFGRKAVFMDVAGSQPGRDVRDVVDDHLVSCAAVLVIVGKAWADARDESGQRRLDNPLDLVRIETAAALTLGLPVIPVLVQGAAMVQPTELPPELADLAFRNPVTLLQSQWGSDVETLVTLLHSLVQGQAPGTPRSSAADKAGEPAVPAAPPMRVARPQPVGQLPWRTMLAAAVAIVVMAAGVYAFMVSRPRPVGPAVARAPQATAGVVAKPGTSASASASTPVAPPAAPPAPSAGVATTVAEKKPAPALPAATAEPPASQASPVARDAAVRATMPATVSAAAKVLSFQKWTLNSGGCGAGAVTVTGTARFSIEKTSDAIVVSEEFRGSGSGFDVVVAGQVEFSREQPSYEIPTAGQWTGAAKVFKSSGLDRVTTSGDGLTPRSANVVKLQSLCG